tara:strand:- start:2529 stop:3032 length:504 start_codon:yes stop_codon:yes gene_type:complete
MKKTILLFSLIIINACTSSDKQNIGYEIEESKKVAITAGKLSSTDVMEEFFDAYNNRDLESVYSLEHEDIILYAPNGMMIEGRDKHKELSQQFLDANSSVRWDILWSVSQEIQFESKPSENWVTTTLDVITGEGESSTKVQRVVDAQIVDSRIKKVFVYERKPHESE